MRVCGYVMKFYYVTNHSGFFVGTFGCEKSYKVSGKTRVWFFVVLVTTYGCAGIDYYGGSILYAISGGVQ